MVSRKFVQLSIPKCYTTAAAAFAREHLDDMELKGNSHAPASTLSPRILDSRTIYAPFRNPWAWWVSWYCHVSNSFGSKALAETYGQGRHDFRSVLQGATQRVNTPIPSAPLLLARWGDGLADDFRSTGWGLLSWVTRRMLSCGRPVTLLDCASLPQTLPGFLGLPPETGAELRPMNTGAERWAGRAVQAPADPASWYDDEMVQWVRDADHYAVELMGYPGPFQPAREPTRTVRIPPIS